MSLEPDTNDIDDRPISLSSNLVKKFETEFNNDVKEQHVTIIVKVQESIRRRYDVKTYYINFNHTFKFYEISNVKEQLTKTSLEAVIRGRIRKDNKEFSVIQIKAIFIETPSSSMQIDKIYKISDEYKKCFDELDSKVLSRFNVVLSSVNSFLKTKKYNNPRKQYTESVEKYLSTNYEDVSSIVKLFNIEKENYQRILKIQNKNLQNQYRTVFNYIPYIYDYFIKRLRSEPAVKKYMYLKNYVKLMNIIKDKQKKLPKPLGCGRRSPTKSELKRNKDAVGTFNKKIIACDDEVQKIQRKITRLRNEIKENEELRKVIVAFKNASSSSSSLQKDLSYETFLNNEYCKNASILYLMYSEDISYDGVKLKKKQTSSPISKRRNKVTFDDSAEVYGKDYGNNQLPSKQREKIMQDYYKNKQQTKSYYTSPLNKHNVNTTQEMVKYLEEFKNKYKKIAPSSSSSIRRKRSRSNKSKIYLPNYANPNVQLNENAIRGYHKAGQFLRK